MNHIDALEAEADRRRADFAATLRKLRNKLTPLGLADESLRLLDPQAQAVDAVGQSLRRNPLPAIPLLLGLGWLVLNARRPPKPAKARKLKRARKPLIEPPKEGNTE